MSISRGRATSPRAIASICCSPPERNRPFWAIRSRSLGKNARTSSKLAAPLSRPAPSAPSRRFSSTVRFGSTRRSSGTHAIPRRAISWDPRPVTSSPRRTTRPRRGRVVLRGEDVTGLGSHEIARRGIAWVPEERRVLPNLTVLENLRLGALGAGRDNGAASFDDVLAFFPRLRERIAQKGRFLSGGEQQMLAIARGLVARPRLMLVDEPTEGLAPLLVENLTGILEEISRSGTTILLVEQTLEVAMRLSHRLYIMDQGRIQFEGTPEELRREPTIQQRFLGV